MKPSDALANRRDAVRSIVLAHRATNPRIFGSVARREDTDDSDLDLLIDPTADTTLLDIGAIRQELLDLLGLSVDVVTPQALPARFRDVAIEQAVPV